MKHVTPDVAVGLGSASRGQAPAVARRDLEGLAEGSNEVARRCVGGIGRGEDARRVGPPERPDLRRGVGHVAPRDQVLEERQPGIVERQVGRALGGRARGYEHAADECGGAKDAGGGGHGRER